MNIDLLNKCLKISQKELSEFTANARHSVKLKDTKTAEYWKNRAVGVSSTINFCLKEIEESLNSQIESVNYLK